MAKPDVKVSARNPVFVGQAFTIDLDVSAAKETKVEYIEATLIGDQGWRIGSGKSAVTHRVKHPHDVAQLMGEGVLPGASTRSFSARFTLPHGTAPTHRMSPAWSRLRLRVHISIPWRIDGRYDYEFEVRMPPPPDVQRTPYAVRSTSRTAAHDNRGSSSGSPRPRSSSARRSSVRVLSIISTTAIRARSSCRSCRSSTSPAAGTARSEAHRRRWC